VTAVVVAIRPPVDYWFLVDLIICCRAIAATTTPLHHDSGVLACVVLQLPLAYCPHQLIVASFFFFKILPIPQRDSHLLHCLSHCTMTAVVVAIPPPVELAFS